MKRAPLPVPQASVEASITELAPGGDGVLHAEIDGQRRAVFVRGVAVGDRVRVAVDASKRPARAVKVELLEPGPDRVASPCAFVAQCGGCDWMHVSLDAQARAHEAHVRAALGASLRDASVTTHVAPAALAYRSRARVHVETTGRRILVGMHEAQSHAPVPVDRCVVLEPKLDRARAELATFFAGSRGRGDAQIALGIDGKPVLELHWTGDLAAACFSQLDRAVASGAWGGARIFLADAKRPAVIGDPTPWMLGADDAPLALAPGGFGQASIAMNRALGRRVSALASEALQEESSHAPGHARGAPPKIVELYAGAGNLTVMLAKLGEVTAVESSAEACDAARKNLAARDLSAKIVTADAATFAWPTSTRLLVLDPPRTGAREVAARLAGKHVKHVIYVSCDPQTLGRDVATLAAAGYAVTSVDVLEMFPQTSHVETITMLEWRRAEARAG